MNNRSILLGFLAVFSALAFSACCTLKTGYEQLTLGTKYNVGDSFSDNGMDFKLVQFYWGNGNPSPDGFAEVYDQKRAGGIGKEIWTNNINVEFVLTRPAKSISFNAGHWGGNMNLSINGTMKNFNNLANVNGTNIAGVQVQMTGSYNNPGIWTFKGPISSFYVGGQEFAIDNICVRQ